MVRTRDGRAWASLAILAAIFVSSRVEAQAPTPHPNQASDASREKERDALYAEGLALARAGRWSDAADRFRGVVAIRSAPKALLALATAEEQVEHLATAWRTFQKALADARAGGRSDDAALAQQGLRALDPRVPRLHLTVSGALGAAHATIDGEPLVIGQPVEVEPGPHTIVVSAEGAPPYSMSLTIAEGERRQVPVELAPNPAPAPPSSEQAAKPPPPQPTPPPEPLAAPETAPQAWPPVPWQLVALGAAGVAVAGVGAYFDGHGLSEHNALASCHSCTQQDVENAKRDMWLGTALLWTGGAALATAVVLYLVHRSEHRSSATSFCAPMAGGAGGALSF